jgi:hypothetical protein
MTNPNTLLSAAEKIGSMFEALLIEMGVQDSGQARIAACLALTIAELFLGVITLLRSRAPSHAPVLVRSMHEALADLKNLVEDGRYLNQMRFDNAEQALKIFKGFQVDETMQDEVEAQKTLREWCLKEQKTYDELKAAGFKTLSILDRFKKVGMATEYATAYRFLCSFAHSDMNTLVARHAGYAGGRHLRFTDNLPPATLKSVLGLALTLYTRAIDTLPRYTNLPPEKVKAVLDAADSLWTTASGGG